ncbi:ATP-binding protein [Methanolobus sp. ZRKC5]|uniref:sensor histidine kinase n=1 Tax=unclassified Methanolobus TaxID=2629569 RepID=UPI00313BD9C1
MIDILRIQHDVVLSSTNSLHENLNVLLDDMLEFDAVDSGAIHFIYEHTGYLEFVASKGFSPEFNKYLNEIKKPTPIMKSVMSGKPSVTKGPDIKSSGVCESCSSENLCVILFYPIKRNDEVIAVMSICSHSISEIPEHVMIVLETIIAHVESIIVRNKVEAKLNSLLMFGKLLSEISTNFIGMEPEKIDESINETLGKIGEMTRVEKVGIFMFSGDYMSVNGIHEWCAEGIESDIKYFDNLSISAHSWWIKNVFKEEPFFINNIEDLPPEAILEKTVLRETNTVSLLVVPMAYRGKIMGNLCLAYSSIKKWPEGYLKILKLMGEVFANTLEHKRKESKIKESECKYRRIFEEMHDIYFETKIDGTIITLSPSITSHLGFEPEELIGNSIGALYSTPQERQNVLDALKVSGHLTNYDIQLKNKNGNLIHLSANTHLVYGADGKPEKMAGVVRDFTEVKNIEKMLIKAKLLLENASNTKSEFLSIVNHELRTPLTHVMGYSEVLLEGYYGTLNTNQAKCAETILDAGSKLLELLTSLNYVAEIEGGKMELDITEFSLLSLISEIQKITGSMAAKKNIYLKFKVDFNIDNVNADRSKLKIILLNLISNAIKFTQNGGAVTVDAMQHTNQSLHISVKDTGIGISEEDQVLLFKPFVQLEPVLNRKNGGAGLGLALVKEFVEVQGGNIRLESEIGKGSTFEFTIPMQCSA